MRLKIQIKGEKELLKKFQSFGDNGEKMVEDITDIKAKDIERNAKTLAPVDLGTLRQNIIDEKINKLSHTITAYEKYSAFMEFGTGGLVSVPTELQSIAIRFKGIKEINIPPHPFMYPSFVMARTSYPKDLKKGLKILTDKFNK